MADVTISNLPTGAPSGNALLPYSQEGTTYSARPSTFVAAVPGTIIQTVITSVAGRSEGTYTGTPFTYQFTTYSNPVGSKFLEVNFTPLYNTSTIIIDVMVSTIAEMTNTSDAFAQGIWKNNTGRPLNASFIGQEYNSQVGYIYGANHYNMINMMATEPAGSTATRTYSYYAGVNNGPAVINAIGSSPSLYGGDAKSIMRIQEITG